MIADRTGQKEFDRSLEDNLNDKKDVGSAIVLYFIRLVSNLLS